MDASRRNLLVGAVGAAAGVIAVRLFAGDDEDRAGAGDPSRPLFFILGPANDSNGRGATAPADEAAFIAAYQVIASNKVWSHAAQAFVRWTPGTVTGIGGIGDDAGVGPECGFFRKANATWPGREILLFKDSRVGSTASRGPIVEEFNGSISADGVLSVHSGDAPATSRALEGLDGPLPGPTHTTTSPLQVRTKPESTYSGGAVDQYDMTAHAIGLSWDLMSGALYTGYYFGSDFSPGFKAKLDACLAKMDADGMRYVYAGALMSIFGNDGRDAGAASRAQASLEALLVRFRSDYPQFAERPICWTRPRNAAPAGETVRAAFAAMTAADPLLKGIEKDDLPLHDGTHLTIAGLDAVGERSFIACGL